MAITRDTNGNIIIEGGESVLTYRLLAMRKALELEIRTGMKMSRGVSIIAVANRDGFSKAKTKQGVLADLNRMIEARKPGAPRPTTQIG